MPAYTFTAADAAASSISGTEAAIAVSAAAATHFNIAPPGTVAAGKAFTIVVTAIDAFGNMATGYRGKVQFKDSMSNNGLPSAYTFTAGDAGVHVFTVALTTTGPQVLTVFDAANATITGSVGLTVAPAQKGGGKT